MAEHTLTLTSQQTTALQTILRRYRDKGSAYLLPCLHDVQNVTGWLDEQVCLAVSQALNVPAVHIHNVIEFYTLFYGEPVGERIIRICDDMACYLAGSKEVIQACAELLGVDPGGGMTADGKFSLEIHPCLGRCEQAPFCMVGDDAQGTISPNEIAALIGNTT